MKSNILSKHMLFIYVVVCVHSSCTKITNKQASQSHLQARKNILYESCSFGVYHNSLRTYQEDMVQGDRIKNDGNIQVLLKETSHQEKFWTFEVKNLQEPNWGAQFKFFKMQLKKNPQLKNKLNLALPPYSIEVIWNEPNRENLKIHLVDEIDSPNKSIIIEAMKILTKGVDILSYPPFSRVVNPLLRGPGLPELYLDYESLETVVEYFEGKVKQTGEKCEMSVFKGAKGDVFKVEIRPGRRAAGVTLGAFFFLPFPLPSLKADSCKVLKIGSRAAYIPSNKSFKIYEDYSIRSTPDGDSQHPLEDNVTQKLIATQKSEWFVSSLKNFPGPGSAASNYQSIEFCGSNLEVNQKVTSGVNLGLVLSLINFKNQRIECEKVVLKEIRRYR